MAIYEIQSIGIIQNNEEGSFIRLNEEFNPALKELDGFSHIQVLWWFSNYDDVKYRMSLEFEPPYKNAPDKMGTFATRYAQTQSP